MDEFDNEPKAIEDYDPAATTELVTKGTGSEYVDEYVGTMLGVATTETRGGDPIDNLEAGKSIISNSENPNQTVTDYLGGLQAKINLDFAQYKARKDAQNPKIPNEGGAEAITEEQAEADRVRAIYSQRGPWDLEATTYLAAHFQEEARGEPANAPFIVNSFQMSTIGRRLEAFGLLKQGVDITKTFGPGYYNTAIENFDDTLDSWGSSGLEEYVKLTQAYRGMNMQEKLQYWPEIEDYLWTISKGNIALYAAWTDDFIDPTTTGMGARMDVLFDALGFTPFILAKAAKVANVVRANRTAAGLYTRLNRKGKAGQIMARVLGDTSGRASRAAGVSPEAAAASGTPFDLAPHVPDTIPGIADDVLMNLRKDLADNEKIISEAFADVADPAFIRERVFFTEEAKRARQQKVLGSYDNIASKATIVKTDDLGFTIEVETVSKYAKDKNIPELEAENVVLGTQIDDLAMEGKHLATLETTQPEDIAAINARIKDLQAALKNNQAIIADLSKPAIKRRQTIFYGANDVGGLDSSASTAGIRGLSSPEVLVEPVLKDVVHQATLAGFDAEKIRTVLTSAFERSIRGISSGSLKIVDEVLEVGNRQERVFSVRELMQGVETANGWRKLGPKEVRGYFAARKMYDEIWKLKNHTMKRTKEFNGFRSVPLTGLTDEAGMRIRADAKPIDSPQTLPAGISRMYDRNAKGIVDVTKNKPAIERRLATGEWKVIKFESAIKVGDEFVNFGLVKESHMFDIPSKVMRYIKGYVPVARPNVYWIARKEVDAVVDGNKTKRLVTDRFFADENEARAWIASQPDAESYRLPKMSREQIDGTPGFEEEFDIASFGGLFSSPRSERDILFGAQGLRPTQMSAYEALQMYLNHISIRYPANELRMNMISRFMNSARGKLADPNDWQSAIVNLPVNSPEYKALDVAQTYLKDFTRIPTSSEQWFQNTMTRVAMTLEGHGKWGKAAASPFMRLSHTDPFGAMRSMAYHALLGWFNARQLLTQAMGASIAMALDPVRAPKYISQYMALRSVMYTRNLDAVRVVGAIVGDVDEFVKLHNEFRMAGLGYSVRTTADWDAARAGLSMTARGFKRTLDLGSIPVVEGELVSRGYAWLMARDRKLRTLAKSTGKNVRSINLTPKQVDEVTKDALRMTLNLNHANRAGFQKGAWSPATQFLQISAKFIEAMMPNIGPLKKVGTHKFTAAEKARILGFQAVLFGTAGVGSYLDDGMTDIYKTVLGYSREPSDDPSVFNLGAVSEDEVMKYLRGGLVEGMIYSATGADVSVSSRLGLPAGVQEAINMSVGGEKDTLQLISGAFGGLPHKFYQGISRSLTILGATNYRVDGNVGRMLAMEMAAPIASFSNAMRANWWWSIQEIRDNNGRLIETLDEDDFGTVLAAGMGLQPAVIAQNRELVDYAKASQKDINDRVNLIVSMMMKYGTKEQYDANPENDVFMGNIFDFVMVDVPDDGEGGTEFIDKVRKSVADRLFNEEEEFYKNFEYAVDHVWMRGGDVTFGGANLTGIPELIPDKAKEEE